MTLDFYCAKLLLFYIRMQIHARVMKNKLKMNTYVVYT